MQRQSWRTLTTVGLTISGLIFSFLGCNQDYGDLKGTCSEDDLNPCTIDKCSADGIITHEAIPDAWNLECSIGLNSGRCSGGQCLLDCQFGMIQCNCSGDMDCPSDNECADWGCVMGKCTLTPLNEGVKMDFTGPGDCQSGICLGGEMAIANDNLDVEPNIPGDCAIAMCVEGIPNVNYDPTDAPPPKGCAVFSCNPTPGGPVIMSDAPLGTPCEGGACDSSAKCVSCLSKADWDKCTANSAPAPCPVKKCNGQTCVDKSHCITACVDGVCCDTTCTEECKSCNLMGFAGTCTNIANYQPDNSYTDPNMMGTLTCTVAANGAVCDGMGNCLKVIGKACMADADCLSAKCAMPTKVCLGAKGEACTMSSSCASGMCTMGMCT